MVELDQFKYTLSTYKKPLGSSGILKPGCEDQADRRA